MSEKTFEERVILAARRTWDVIGGDCLVDEYGEIDYSVTMTKEEVCEMVSDASHMQTNGGLSAEDMRRFYKLGYPKTREIVRKAFNHNTYGW